MTYHGIVSHGVIVLQEDGALAEGTRVEVRPIEGEAESLGELPAFGLWRDRSDMTDSGEASLSLRALAEHRNRLE